MKYLRGTLMKNARPGLPKIGIILTDGRSTNEAETKKEAAKTKAAGITLIAIGVGDKTSREELKAIASGPNFVYDVQSYDALLGDFIRRFATDACPGLMFLKRGSMIYYLLFSKTFQLSRRAKNSN